MFAVTFRRYYCVAIPSWVADFTRDAGGVVSKTATAYQFRGWEGADAETKVKLAKGELSKKYHKILVKDPISFCTPLDNPVESTPEMDCSLWWDAEDDTQRLYLQLGPQFPPLLWFPIKPSSSTVSRIFDDFEQNNTKYLESATPHYEAYLSSGSLALESSELKDSITPQISSHSTSPQSTTTVSSNQIVSWAAPGEVGDLYRRTAGLLSSLTIKREYENNIWYHLGSTVSPEEVESKMNKNSFLFTRYPMTVISGEQRTKPGPRPVLCTTYRTIFSKSIIMFTTRDDEPHINVTVSNKKYDEESGLYCCVDHPSSVRMSGGAAVVERFNREFGTDYPITTPVDVLGALALFRSKALSQIEKEYNVVAGTFFGGTKDAVAEVARRQQLTLPEEDQKYLNDLKTLAHSSDSAIADDASHPVNSQVLQYIRRLAIMKYPDFEQKCFLPFWNLPSKHIRVKVHEACCIAGRPDLADLLLSRESDEYVVKQIAFTEETNRSLNMGSACSSEPAKTEQKKPAKEQKKPDGGKPKPDTKPEKETKPDKTPDEVKPTPEPTPDPKPEEEKKPEPKPEPEKEKPDPKPVEDGGNDSKPIPDTVPDEKPSTNVPVVVTRTDIRKMSSDDVDRFFKAFEKTMENKSGPGTSEFFRIASYHGEPSPYYCQHGRETFPGWHRVYLLEFEKALQVADKSLGNDGNISLPYWDWGNQSELSNGLPDIVRERHTGWPADFWPTELRSNSMTSSLRRAPNSNIANQLRSWELPEQAKQCMLATEHWAFASTRWPGTYPSVEVPHNSIHVIVGGSRGNMGSVAWAAYDIAFWLHHCNVDRLYEVYLGLEPDSHDEFRNFQQTQPQNRFNDQFEPFRKSDGSAYFPTDTFKTKDLGYVYSELPPVPDTQLLREAPTVLLFADVNIAKFESKCYQIHVFVVDKDQPWTELKTESDLDYDSKNYAGGQGVFGRGSECDNCVTRPPTDIIIDISETMRRLGLTRTTASAKIYIVETTTETTDLLSVADTELPQPLITGPLFDIPSDAVVSKESQLSPDSVKSLQLFLKKHGYYETDLDGDFGQNTHQAIVDFQEAAGIAADGLAGPITRTKMTNKRCQNIDGFAKNDVTDSSCRKENFDYQNKKVLKYFISTQPGYLTRDDAVGAIQKACENYNGVAGLKLEMTEAKSEADITFCWKMFEASGHIFRFDGNGGVLGRGTAGLVEFDAAERWVTGNDASKISNLHDKKTWFRGIPSISLYHTALHELGHTLGMEHSSNPSNVMSPFYNPSLSVLSDGDKATLVKLWGPAE